MPNWAILNRRAFLAGLAGGAAYAASKKPAELAGVDLEGRKVRLSSYRGNIVVLNFWATWCGPCRHEMPLLVAAEKDYRSRGVIFVGASVDDAKTRRKVPDFVREHGVAFPIWTGPSGDDMERLAMGPSSPATAFVDAEGYIAARVSGEIRRQELDERLVWLLPSRRPWRQTRRMFEGVATSTCNSQAFRVSSEIRGRCSATAETPGRNSLSRAATSRRTSLSVEGPIRSAPRSHLEIFVLSV